MNHQHCSPGLTPFALALAAALATMVPTVTFAANCIVAGSITWSADNCVITPTDTVAGIST